MPFSLKVTHELLPCRMYHIEPLDESCPFLVFKKTTEFGGMKERTSLTSSERVEVASSKPGCYFFTQLSARD
eukprot:c27832_g1_i1 orf=22-237(+)